MQKNRKNKIIVWLVIGGSLIALIGSAVVFFFATETGRTLWKLTKMFDSSVEIVETHRADPTTSVPMVPQDDELEFVDAPLEEEEDVEILIENAEQPHVESIHRTEQKNDDIVNILILGQDGEHILESSNRTDVMILASFNQRDGSLKLVSFQRDAYVPLADKDYWNRLNTCYHFGGAGLSINTFNSLFDLDIQYYVTLAFDEFEMLIDSIGGIDLELTKKEADRINSVCGGVKEGMSHLNGEQALMYARNRSTGTGDWGRTERQRKVLMAILNKVRSEFSAEMALDLISFAGDYIRTNIPAAKLVTLGTTVLQAETLTVSTAKVPFDDTWHYARKKGASVIVFDIEKNAELLNEYLYPSEE